MIGNLYWVLIKYSDLHFVIIVAYTFFYFERLTHFKINRA